MGLLSIGRWGIHETLVFLNYIPYPTVTQRGIFSGPGCADYIDIGLLLYFMFEHKKKKNYIYISVPILSACYVLGSAALFCVLS